MNRKAHFQKIIVSELSIYNLKSIGLNFYIAGPPASLN